MRLLRFLDRWIEQIVIAALCSILVLSLSYAAIVRYFLPFPALTSLSHMVEELAIFSFVWVLYWGSVLATKEGGHFRVSAHVALLPKAWRRWAFLPGDLVWLSFNLFVVWQGLILVESALERPQPSLSLRVPMEYVYAIIPLAFVLTCVRLVQTYLRAPRGDAAPAHTSQT